MDKNILANLMVRLMVGLMVKGWLIGDKLMVYDSYAHA